MIRKFLLLIGILLPLNVFATSYDTAVSNNLSYNECLNFQDNRIATSGSGYLGYCKKASCYTGDWNLANQNGSSSMLYCTNENKNPYTQIINDGCSQYKGSCTLTADVKYCSQVVYYDCSKTNDGKVYETSSKITTTKTTTTKVTTTTTTQVTTEIPTTTTVVYDSNNYLSSLVLSEGNISFNKNTIFYNIEVDENVTNIEVEAKAESEKATVEIENNKNISENNPITITVTAEDKTVRIYTINIHKKSNEPVLSNNNLIHSLSIKDYQLNFKDTVNDYQLRISEDIKQLEIAVTLDDENSNYIIIGNDNLKNGSKINIVVTAEDGNENIYTIKIKKRNSLLIKIIVILIILVLCIIGIKFLINLIPAKKDSKYEYE